MLFVSLCRGAFPKAKHDCDWIEFNGTYDQSWLTMLLGNAPQIWCCKGKRIHAHRSIHIWIQVLCVSTLSSLSKFHNSCWEKVLRNGEHAQPLAVSVSWAGALHTCTFHWPIGAKALTKEMSFCILTKKNPIKKVAYASVMHFPSTYLCFDITSKNVCIHILRSMPKAIAELLKL